MQKIGQFGDTFILLFETNVEKELFKEAIKTLPGINQIKDKEGGTTLKFSVLQGSLAEKFFQSFQSRPPVKFDREDLYYYTNLFLKHPLLKLFIAISFLGVKVGVLSFLICSQIMFPLIKKSVG